MARRADAQPDNAPGPFFVDRTCIDCGTGDKIDLRAAAGAFPHPLTDDVFFCGYTSEKSFGAWSYLIRRPGGNVLMDCPRGASRPPAPTTGTAGPSSLTVWKDCWTTNSAGCCRATEASTTRKARPPCGPSWRGPWPSSAGLDRRRRTAVGNLGVRWSFHVHRL